MKLVISENKRFLMWEDGKPFFYLGDTAWEMLHKLSREETEWYFSIRAKQGFTVIQTVLLAEFEGLTKPNCYGRLPLKQVNGAFDPEQPDIDGEYSYWEHVDYAVRAAADKGLFLALLPTWGDKFNKLWGQGPEIFTPENAYTYAKWLGQRYRDNWNIIWILGGDRPLDNDVHKEIIRKMGNGLRESDGNHLITYHPVGSRSSADFVSNKDYIDFHTVQSGHATDCCYESHLLVRRTGEAEPKPFMDSEPRYEDHPACFKAEYDFLWDAADVRMNAYWDVLEGTCGHTYGNHSIWSFKAEPQAYWPYRWQEVLHHEGAETIHHVRNLRESRPYFELRRAPELVDDNGGITGHIAAARGDKYAFIYSPFGLPVTVHFDSMGCKVMKASWFNPRNGELKQTMILPGKGSGKMIPPSSGKGNDWVLVLDVME